MTENVMDVCVVTILHDMGFSVFGVYDCEDTARKRVNDHIEMGVISEDDIIQYHNECVWHG